MIPIVSEQADVRFWYARMLIERANAGGEAKARQYVEEAMEIYRRIGAPEWSQKLLDNGGL